MVLIPMNSFTSTVRALAQVMRSNISGSLAAAFSLAAAIYSPFFGALSPPAFLVLCQCCPDCCQNHTQSYLIYSCCAYFARCVSHASHIIINGTELVYLTNQPTLLTHRQAAGPLTAGQQATYPAGALPERVEWAPLPQGQPLSAQQAPSELQLLLGDQNPQEQIACQHWKRAVQTPRSYHFARSTAA
jgi:hypothetical protein